MYYTVRTLLSRGKNISQIAKELGIDRKTVRKIRDRLKDGQIKPPEFARKSILEPYREQIVEYLSKGLSAVLIHQELLKEEDLSVSYSCVKKYVRKLKKTEGVYIPLISPPAEEAQVDFGYVGYLYDRTLKRRVKTWVFCMVLSYSRYKYYEIVQSQDVQTFLKCHINAFEFFGGTPKMVKIDNLKSGVLKTNLYEPTIQKEYSDMLAYYSSEPFACRVRYPQEKGKVESGIKYVKNNFFKSTKETDYHRLKELLRDWQDNVCNKKIHGTTKKIPLGEFVSKEKDKLTPLPNKRYEVYEISDRVVNRYAHITYRYNYYSVPYSYIGSKVHIKSNGNILKIYNNNYEEIATHEISKSKGEFITNRSHNPKLQTTDYTQKTSQIGKNTFEFYKRLKYIRPRHYHRMMQGVLNLAKRYGENTVELACKRAIEFNAISYLSLKRICETGLFEKEQPSKESVLCSGYSHNLSKYDLLTK